MRMLKNGSLNPDVRDQFLQCEQSDAAWCQFLKIAGPTRSGKSTFANRLFGGGAFQTSDSCEPCTQGVDLSPFQKFSTLSERFDEVSVDPSNQMLVGILDIEGGGDRSTLHDVKNYLPSFMLPGVVVWNVIGHPPRTELLSQLGVIAHVGQLLREQQQQAQLLSRQGSTASTSSRHSSAATDIKPFATSAASSSGTSPTFPNDLIIVIRDYQLSSPVALIESRLLQPEPMPGDPITATTGATHIDIDEEAEQGQNEQESDGAAEVAERNRLRVALRASFYSVKVVVLPPRSAVAEYESCERTLIHMVLERLSRNPLRLNPLMCWDLLSDLTRQIERDPDAVNVGSALAYITLCNFNRRLRSAEEKLAEMFQRWYHESQFITTEADATAQFDRMVNECWIHCVPPDTMVPVGEGVGDTLAERQTVFYGVQRRALLEPRLGELRLMQAERTIQQLELAACQMRRDQERARHVTQEVFNKASELHSQFLKGDLSAFPDLFRQALVIPSNAGPVCFETYYHDHDLDTLVNAFTRDCKHIEEQGVCIDDVFNAEETVAKVVRERMGDVFAVEDLIGAFS